jgi:hypothetical protein
MSSSPTCAALPVPVVTTSESMSLAVCATSGGMTCFVTGLFSAWMPLPSGPTTSSMATGPRSPGARVPDTRVPLFASVEYA